MKAAIAGVWIIAAASAAADDSIRDYRWRHAIQGEAVSGRLYRVRVTDALYDASAAFPADVRVVDQDGRVWPFFVWNPTGRLDLASLKLMAPPPEDVREGIQTILLDVGARHVPTAKLVFDVAATNFARPVKIYGRNSPTNQWRWVADGGVHRMEGDVRDTVDLRGCEYRWLKVDLYRYEGPELDIRGVSGARAPTYLVVEAASDRTRFAYSDSARVVFPRFDLARRARGTDVESLAELALGPRRMNPERLAISLGRYSRWLAIAAGVLVAVLMTVLLARRGRASVG